MPTPPIIIPRRHRLALRGVSRRYARLWTALPGGETYELPLKILFVGDYTARPDPRPLEDRRPHRVRAETFDTVRAQLEPAGGDALWAELRETVAAIGDAGDVLVEILNCSREDLVSNFEDAPDIFKSALYKLVYLFDCGSYGGTPIDALIGHYDLGRLGPLDRALVTCIAEVAANAHVPFFDVGEAALAVDDPALLSAAPPGRAFVATEAARYVRLGVPAGIGARLAASHAQLGFCSGAVGLDEEAAKLFVATRTAAAVKTMYRAFLGAWRTPEAIEAGLGAFLAAHTKAEGLFAEARIEVEPARAEALYYRFVMVLRPHREAPGEPVTVRVVGKLDKN